MSIGLTYKNKKDSLGNGLTMMQPKSYTDSFGVRWIWNSADGVYEMEETVVVDKRNASGNAEGNNNYIWIKVAAAVLIVTGIALGAKKFF